MFFQPPEDGEPSNSKTFQINRRRRQKKIKRKNKKKAVKKDLITKKKNLRAPVPITMSSWAENFTTAATWQLKHQVAYWKSKATALEYENKLLHDIIRKNYTSDVPTVNSTTSSDHEDQEDQEEESSMSEEENNGEEGDLVVSEEFIEFLRENKKYRDDAKRERDKLKAQHDTEQQMIEEMEAGPSENVEDPQEVLKRLYGDKWQRIAALETSIWSQFISICDQEKPPYWPNIPFNFNV